MRQNADIVSAYLERPIRSLYETCRTRSRDRGLAQPPCHACRLRDLCNAGRAKRLGYVVLRPRAAAVPGRLTGQEVGPVVELIVEHGLAVG